MSPVLGDEKRRPSIRNLDVSEHSVSTIVGECADSAFERSTTDGGALDSHIGDAHGTAATRRRVLDANRKRGQAMG